MATRKKRHENSRCVRGDSVYTRSCSRRHTKKPKDTKKYIQVKAFSTDSIDLVDGSCPPSFRLLLIYIYIYIYKCFFFSLFLSSLSLLLQERASGRLSDRLATSPHLIAFQSFSSSSSPPFSFSLSFSRSLVNIKRIYIYQHLSILYLGLLLRETGKSVDCVINRSARRVIFPPLLLAAL